MTDPATTLFISDYKEFNRRLSTPHPYFQRIEYVKVNRMMIKQVLKRKHDSILDIGGGTGHLIMGLSGVSKEAVILDIEGSRLPEINKRNPKICCFCADVECGFPFKDDSFDVVIASELLEHLNDADLFFSESHRILRKSGNLILTTPNSENLTYKIFSRLPKAISNPLAVKAGVDMKLHPQLRELSEKDLKDPHIHKVEGYSKAELEALGKKHDLVIIHYKNFGLPLPDKFYLHVPKSLTRFIVNHLEDRFPFALRHFIVYENK